MSKVLVDLRVDDDGLRRLKACPDTHYRYPMPPDHPLWRMPNVIMTPHVSGSSGSSFYLQRVWDIFAQNVERFQKGRPLLNKLSPSKLIGSPKV